MYLKYLQIVNFKNLRNVRFEYDKDIFVILDINLNTEDHMNSGQVSGQKSS